MKKFLKVCVVAAMTAVGCGGGKNVVTIPSNPDIPIWAQRASGQCVDIPDRHVSSKNLCGVGIAENIRSYSLGVETASSRARAEIAKVLESQMAAFNQAVQDSLSKDGAIDEIQKVQSAVETMVRRTVSGVTIPATYHDRENNVFFALAMIDTETFSKALTSLGDAAQLSERAKAEVQRRAEDVMNAWERAEERQRDSRR